METVCSDDRTTIAFDRYGQGAAVVMVGGAFQHRAFDPPATELASRQADHFTVFHYGRRRRGDRPETP